MYEGTVTVGMCKGQRGEVVAFTATLPLKEMIHPARRKLYARLPRQITLRVRCV